MKTFLKTLIVTIIVISLASCFKNNSDLHYYIKIINNSSKGIYFGSGLNYPDTIISPYNVTNEPKHFRVDPNSIGKYYSYPGSWESICGNNKEEGLTIFLFDAEILDSSPWDSVLKNYLILERFSLTLNDLDSMNWTIIHN